MDCCYYSEYQEVANTPYRLSTQCAIFDCSKGTECALCAQSAKGISDQYHHKFSILHFTPLAYTLLPLLFVEILLSIYCLFPSQTIRQKYQIMHIRFP